jgi:type IV pilus assembly protein PilO
MSWLSRIHEQLKPLPFWQRWALTVIPIVFIALLFYFLIYNGKGQQIAALQQEVNSIETILIQAKGKAAALPELKNRHEELEIVLSRLVAQLPETKEIPKLLIEISGLGRKSGLEFILFKPQPEQTKEFYTEIPVDMEIQGRFHDLARFFDQIGKLSRIVNIRNIKISEPKMEGESVKVKANCLALTFRSLRPEEMGQENNATEK